MIDSMIIYTWGIIALDLVIAIAAISVLRSGAGVLFGVDTTNELAGEDNVAFGLTLAGGVIAVALILAAAGSGEAAESWSQEAMLVLMYGVVGVVLLKVGLLINDAVMFNAFSLRTAISGHNLAASLVQASNLVALGLLIHGAIGWVVGSGWQAFVSMVVVFFLAQLVVLAATRYRAAIYGKRHDGESWQAAIEGGNTALATRYAGHLIGIALASSSAGGMVEYLHGFAWDTYALWLGYALLLAAALTLFALVARKIILRGIDVVEEVDRQANVGVAAIEAAIFVGIGLVMKAVIG
jgi:uncharacterized membrane protein YjfL (UPF0719 family)